MVTLQDVAKKANVSVMTVSRIINNPEKVKESTRQKVQKGKLKKLRVRKKGSQKKRANVAKRRYEPMIS